MKPPPTLVAIDAPRECRSWLGERPAGAVSDVWSALKLVIRKSERAAR